MIRYLVLGVCLAIGSAGCAVVPPLDNPLNVEPPLENPALVSPVTPDADSYAELWEHIIDVLDDHFELKAPSRYAGYVESKPRIAPGYLQPWKLDSPDNRERLISTLQTIRHTAKINVSAGDRGGYKVYVEVWRELLDLDRPSRALVGPAVFQEGPTVDRRYDVVTADTTGDKGWIPSGRDFAFEQYLLRKIQEGPLCRKKK